MTADETVQEFNTHYGHGPNDCLFVARLRERGLTTEHIAAVIEVLEGICDGCMNNDIGCYCRNDE